MRSQWEQHCHHPQAPSVATPALDTVPLPSGYWQKHIGKGSWVEAGIQRGCSSSGLHRCLQMWLSSPHTRCAESPSQPTTKHWRRAQAGGWRPTGFAPMLAKHRSLWSRTDPSLLHSSPAQQWYCPSEARIEGCGPQKVPGELASKHSVLFLAVLFCYHHLRGFAAGAADGLETGSELGLGAPIHAA